ncbi:hypothetical protein ElyMa_001785000 [Elysia marginata]|uniref:Nose resistant-to-fluoxetine protein N-terminal domain-containing protein n=1 Tax=Elysia marginata TaxID=1093978 RepID=A0AAV4EDK9_9GAST|nr:hypothetical protein ElyMa_001785000 [Elysia marginata]
MLLSFISYPKLVFDAWGKVPPGLLKIYANFRGEYKECREIRVPPVSANLEQLAKHSPLSLLDFATLESVAEEQNQRKNDGDDMVSLESSDFSQDMDGHKRKFPEFRGKFCHVGVTLKGVHIAGGQAVVVSTVLYLNLLSFLKKFYHSSNLDHHIGIQNKG